MTEAMVDEIVKRLNEMLHLDREALSILCAQVTCCNEQLIHQTAIPHVPHEAHPLQAAVQGHAFRISTLSIINGLIESPEWTIVACFSVTGTISKFMKIQSEHVVKH